MSIVPRLDVEYEWRRTLRFSRPTRRCDRRRRQPGGCKPVSSSRAGGVADLLEAVENEVEAELESTHIFVRGMFAEMLP
jgi:hypothetical protein